MIRGKYFLTMDSKKHEFKLGVQKMTSMLEMSTYNTQAATAIAVFATTLNTWPQL